MDKKITIAIDGFSSTGKSTLAKQLAQKLGYIYVDTGAMYRGIAYYAIKHSFIKQDFFDKDGLIKSLPNIKLQFQLNTQLGFAEMYLNDINVEKEIRTIEVSNYVSKVAEVSEIRLKLVQQQQQTGKNKGIVMDGRDIATVVFPDADLKIFMTANALTRAQRRFEELLQNGETVTFDQVLKNIENRDFIDTHRNDSPLFKDKNAIEIDSSHLTQEEQLNKVLALVHNLQ